MTTYRAPRQYAAEIIKLKGSERKAAFARVPNEFQPLVKHYVTDWLKSGRLKRAAKATAERLAREPVQVRNKELDQMHTLKRQYVESILCELLVEEVSEYAT